MIIAMEYAAGGTLLELLDARVKICLKLYSFPNNFNILYIYSIRLNKAFLVTKFKKMFF